MSKEEVMQKVREMARQDKSLIGATIEIAFRDKKTNKVTKEKIKIEE